MRHHVRSLLVVGGARSGKSAYAQRLAEGSGRALVYCATAVDYGDPEMQVRIARHRADRDARWTNLEAPLDLVGALRAETAPDRTVLVDCLTLWLTNLILGAANVEAKTTALAEILPALPGPVIFVSNEVGQGIVPDSALGRTFRDAQGRLNQRMAVACDAVVLMAAGLPALLKPRAAPDLAL